MNSRTQLLAQALDAEIVEDLGYRGLLHSKERGFLRFHISNGLQRVVRTGRLWRVVETILTAEDVDSFLKEVGLYEPRVAPQILATLCEKIGGEIVERFTGGGGVINLEGNFIRYSPITGLDVVYQALTKWVRVTKIMRILELHKLVRAEKWEEIVNATRVRTNGRRSTSSGGETPAPKGEEDSLPEKAS